MSTPLLLRALFLIASISCLATAFIPTTPTALSRNRNTPLTVPPSSQRIRDNSRWCCAREQRRIASGAAALCMSDYEGGGYDGGGQQEVRMEMQELHVEFTDDGRILLEVKGVKGEECKEITEDLIKALGDVIHTENTREYFEEKVTEVNVEGVKVGTEWSYDSNMPEW